MRPKCDVLRPRRPSELWKMDGRRVTCRPRPLPAPTFSMLHIAPLLSLPHDANPDSCEHFASLLGSGGWRGHSQNGKLRFLGLLRVSTILLSTSISCTKLP